MVDNEKEMKRIDVGTEGIARPPLSPWKKILRVVIPGILVILGTTITANTTILGGPKGDYAHIPTPSPRARFHPRRGTPS
jgi:hypothetical protein